MTSQTSTPTTIGIKAVRSVAALGVRQIIVHGMNGLTGILLARVLSPADFGLFAIVTFVLTFLVAFGDVGLGASLIREPAEPSEEDLRAVFTAQQILVVIVVAVAWVVSPVLARAYHLPVQQALLFRLLACSLFFTSLQVIPSVRLERHLEFQKLAAVEVAQAIVYNGVMLGLVFAGWGTLSFALGLLARSIAGAAMINWVSPWRIGWRWDAERIRRHMHFGLPYQGIAFTSLLKDSITPIFVGFVLGTSAVGYINWAGMVAVYPVWALMVLQRVYLPAFARMQAHKEQLGRFVERVIFTTNVIVAPIAVVTFVLIHPLTLLVFGGKWLVATPLFRLLWVANLFVATTTPVMGLLNALGHSRTSFAFAFAWMSGTWVLGVPLIVSWHTLGFGLANIAVTLSAPFLIRMAQRRVRFRVLRVIAPPWLLAAGMGLSIYVFQRIVAITSVATLVVVGMAGFLLFGFAMIRLYSEEVRDLALALGKGKHLSGLEVPNTVIMPGPAAFEESTS